MPTPAQLCCAAEICCPPGSQAAKAALEEVLAEFVAEGLDGPRVFSVLADKTKPPKPRKEKP